MEWYEIQTAYEISQKVFSTGPINNSPKTDFFLLETIDNISDFFCQILLCSKPTLDSLKEAIQKRIEDFNLANNSNLTLDELINKNWLREIFSEIYIPAAVLKFAEQEYKLNGCKQNSSLLFIKQLHDIYGYEDKRELYISKSDFEAIYNKFKHFNPTFPNIDYLLEEYNIRKEKNGYYFTLWNLNGKVSELLPVKLLIYIYRNNVLNENSLINWIHLTRYISIKNILNILPEDYASTFIDTAITIIKSEKDLQFKDEKTEVLKIILDSYSFFREKIDLYKLDTKDISIDFSNHIKFWYEVFHSDKFIRLELFASDIREKYTKFLVAFITDNNPHRFRKTYQMLLSDLEKTPFIFLEIIVLLRHHAPEKFLLLIDDTPAGVVFLCEYLDCCLSETMRYHKFASAIDNQIQTVFQTFLKQFLKQSNTDTKLLAFILLYLLKRKDLYKKDSRKDTIETLISELKTQCRNYVQRNRSLELITGYTEFYGLYLRDYDNSLKTLPFDYYFTILDFWKDDKTKCSKFALQLYEEYVSALSVDSQISIMDAYQVIMQFEWIRLIAQLFETDKSKFESFCNFYDQFFHYREPKNSKDYDCNTNNATRIRIHLIVLVNAFLSAQFVNKDLHKQLEKVIYGLLKKSFSNDVKKRKLFLFSSSYESKVSFNNEIFPYISKALLNLEQKHKESIFKMILKEAPYNIWLELYELLGEKDRRYFDAEFERLDFTKIKDKSFTIPELYTNTVRVTNLNISKSFSHILFSKLDSIVKERASKGIIADFTINCESLRLFLLYKDNKRNELESYSFPYTNNNFEFKEGIKGLERQKRYYLALLNIADDKILPAYNILLGLHKEAPENSEYKAMFLYVSCFKKIEEKDSDFGDLLEQIEQMLKTTDSSEYFYERLQYSKLVILDESGVKDKLDYFYTLPEILRTNVYYVSRVIKEQKERDEENKEKQQNKAFDLFYNISEEWKETSEYKKLAKQFNTDEQKAAKTNEYISHNLRKLQDSYSRIICLSDKERFKVLPDNISIHHNNAGDFILYEVYEALQSILDKIATVTNLQTEKEDKITDLIEILLKARLQKLKYDVAVQGRSGVSETGDSCGEPDMRICFQTYKIILESLRFTRPSYNDLKKHILKIFNYDSSKNYLFDLIYYQENNNKFIKRWNTIKEKILAVDYPPEYPITSNEDLSQEYQNGGIKILKVKHENELVFYHVMVNLCYAEKN